ncbi:MAG: Xaa-Pro peptidase family protein, partial [Planctomycetia bacterium]|nr:Xaa-Pro peptidase family protein [Planctomycetia bacterium]
MIPRFRERCDALRTECRRQEVQAMLVTNFVNVTYLSGFTGDDSYLIVHQNGQILVSDFRYEIQLADECPGLDLSIREAGVSIVRDASEVLRSLGASSVGIEADSMSVALLESFQEALPTVAFRPVHGAVERLRMIKDAEEIAETREAIRIAQKAFAVMRASLTPEMTETEVTRLLEFQMRTFGAKDIAFPSIVAVGSNAALCHFQPGHRRVGEGNLLLVDWGAKAKLYRSDLTRTLITGKPTAELEKIYHIVLEANRKA